MLRSEELIMANISDNYKYKQNDTAVSLADNAAKAPADTSIYATPTNTFSIKDYFYDSLGNYIYITPFNAPGDFGYWGCYYSSDFSAYGIAKNCYYYKNQQDEKVAFKFVNKKSAPLLHFTDRTPTTGGIPFDSFNTDESGKIISTAKYIKIQWHPGSGSVMYSYYRRTATFPPSVADLITTHYGYAYGTFLLLTGAGGGGGGTATSGSSTGAGGGGGGATALAYFDAFALYSIYGATYPKCCLWINVGDGGAGGTSAASSSGITDGSVGEATVAGIYLDYTDASTLICSISADGGNGGNSNSGSGGSALGGNGGVVTTYVDVVHSHSKAVQILKLLSSVTGGKGGIGYRASAGHDGFAVTGDTIFKLPFTYTWTVKDTFTYNSTSWKIGLGAPHYQDTTYPEYLSCGGGGGGSALGCMPASSSDPAECQGYGYGGNGGVGSVYTSSVPLKNGWAGKVGHCTILSYSIEHTPAEDNN